MSQIRTVVSALPEARSLPSDEKASAVTSPVCPLSRRISLPVAACHKHTVWFSPAEASSLLSGENAKGDSAIKLRPGEGQNLRFRVVHMHFVFSIFHTKIA